MGPMLWVPSSFSVVMRTTGVPQYRTAGEIMLCMMRRGERLKNCGILDLGKAKISIRQCLVFVRSWELALRYLIRRDCCLGIYTFKKLL